MWPFDYFKKRREEREKREKEEVEQRLRDLKEAAINARLLDYRNVYRLPENPQIQKKIKPW